MEFNEHALEARDDEYAHLIKEETIEEQRAELMNQQLCLKRRLENLDKQEEAHRLKMQNLKKYL